MSGLLRSCTDALTTITGAQASVLWALRLLDQWGGSVSLGDRMRGQWARCRVISKALQSTSKGSSFQAGKHPLQPLQVHAQHSLALDRTACCLCAFYSFMCPPSGTSNMQACIRQHFALHPVPKHRLSYMRLIDSACCSGCCSFACCLFCSGFMQVSAQSLFTRLCMGMHVVRCTILLYPRPQRFLHMHVHTMHSVLPMYCAGAKHRH